jgi:endoglucanase
MNFGDSAQNLLIWSWDKSSYEIYTQLFKAAGFDHVRIPFFPERVFKLKGTVKAERYDYAIQTVIDNGMIAIFDLHEYPGYRDGLKLDEEQFISFWREAAERYKDYPDQLYFELANEVYDTISARELSAIINNTISAIRETNPTRKIIVPAPYVNRLETIAATDFPEEDRNLIVAIHFYEPGEFTFQKNGAGVEWKGTDAEKRAIASVFDTAAAWAIAKDRPVVLGEFGLSKYIPSPDRELWAAFVRETAERRNIGWTYWDLYTSFGLFEPGGFSYDMDMLKALIPETEGMTGPGFTTPAIAK